jgi:hypothetical protein
MRRGIVFVVVGLLSLALAVIFAGSSYAQSTAGNISSNPSAITEYADNVVSLETSAVQAPVTNVYWGRWGCGPRPYWRRPYYRYGYYARGLYPRCWWNGWRWICPPKRVVIY